MEGSVSDPALREKLSPRFEFGCKRILISDDYWSSFERESSGNLAYLDVRRDVQDRYNASIQRRTKYTSWTSGCHSWYLGEDGSSHALFPGDAREYCLRARRFEPSEYEIVSIWNAPPVPLQRAARSFDSASRMPLDATHGCVFASVHSSGVVPVEIRMLLLLIALSGVAELPAAAAAPDPRLAEANALLGDAEQYDRVVALYRAILGDAPETHEARRWLARVLSWQGRYGESLREYARLLDDAGNDAELETERAEVLSWEGRYPEAEQAFREILEREPTHGRAARGLARVYAWSDRPTLAANAYERALALEDDEEARAELHQLRYGLDWGLSADVRYRADSENYSFLRNEGRAVIEIGRATRLFVRTGSTRIESDPQGPAPAGLSNRSELVAVDGAIGVERRLDERWTARLEVGRRGWSGAPDHFLARGELSLQMPTHGVLGLEVMHGDFLERSDSFDAVNAGVRDTTVRLTGWQPLHARVASFAWIEASFLDDSNTRLAGGLSIDFRPWADRDASVYVAGSYVGFLDDSVLYYDPKTDVGATLGLSGAQPLPAGLALEARVEGGFGYTRQDGDRGLGPTFSVSGGPSWRHRSGWRIALEGSYSLSQRTGIYALYGGSLSLGRSF